MFLSDGSFDGKPMVNGMKKSESESLNNRLMTIVKAWVTTLQTTTSI